MTTIYKYRLFNITATTYEYTWAENPPTLSPSNTSDTIDLNSITIVDKRDPNLIEIKEESTPTGGHFGAHTLSMTVTGTSTGTKRSYFPMPVSVLSVEFVTEEKHRGDSFSLSIGPDTTYGVIVANTLTNSHWTPQSYVVDDLVFFSDRNYKCIKNATASDVPASLTTGFNLNYWKPEPYTLYVSSTVIENIKKGYHVTLFDSGNQIYTKLGRVASVDTETNSITTELAPTYEILASSPTYVLVTVYLIWQYEIGSPWGHIIGESKIGGSYLPANTAVQVEYTNNGNSDTHIIGHVEYLY